VPHPLRIVPTGGGPVNPPPRGPVDSPAALRGSGSYRVRHLSADPHDPAMRQPFRLLVTGSRTWNDSAIIERTLAAIQVRHPGQCS
jgi:hypothetical protein